MQSDFEVFRAERLIKEIVARLQLNFDGLNVLTEAGSNHFIYTPLIACYAGAAKVFVWSKDTAYGQACDIQASLQNIIKRLGIDAAKFEFGINERPPTHVAQADVVTNLGFVRPIDKPFIDAMKSGAVISYMCEAWEIRPSDVDIQYAQRAGIPVAGVWENHPGLRIFDGCGPLSVKLCLEAGFEVYQNKILVLSSDKFGKVAANAFRETGASTVDVLHPLAIEDADFSAYDFLFVSDYSVKEEIIGKRLQAKLAQLKKSAVVHLCGAVDQGWLQAEGVYTYPVQPGSPLRMTRTLAHLGMKSVIDLHAAGMKVGEHLYKRTQSDLVQTI